MTVESYEMGKKASASNVDEQYKLSVLMSVYNQEDATFLKDSLSSVFQQTYPIDQLVLVCDGKLSEDLETVISTFEEQYPDILQLVRKEKNEGLGLALHDGLQYCRNEWVARMDSDDISLPNRFEKQMTYIKDNPETDVLGTSIWEFNSKEGQTAYQRLLPEHHQDIINFAKTRNPLNHSTILFRKSKVLSVGSYVDFPYFEDYHLIVRLIQANAIFHNLQEPLLNFRFNRKTLARRQGDEYVEKEKRFMKECYRLNFLSKWEYYRNSKGRKLLRMLPTNLLRWVYRNILRTKVKQ